jgi:hypothetical protein
LAETFSADAAGAVPVAPELVMGSVAADGAELLGVLPEPDAARPRARAQAAAAASSRGVVVVIGIFLFGRLPPRRISRMPTGPVATLKNATDSV